MNMEKSLNNGFGFTPIGKIKIQRLKWFIEGIIPRGVLVFISGSPKSGKSMLILHMIICLTKGLKFLRNFRSKKVKCLLYSLEDHTGEIKARVKYMLDRRRFPKYFFISKAESINLPMDFDRVEEDIKTSGVDVVFIDTLRRSHSHNEDSSTDMAPILGEIRKLIRKHKVTIVIIHHAGHEVGNVHKSGDWLRGTSDYDGTYEVLIGLKKNNDCTRAYVFHKYRSDYDFSYQVKRATLLDETTKDYPIVNLQYFDSDAVLQEKDEKYVMDILKHGPLSANGIEETLKKKLSRPRIDAALERLLKKGKVKKVGRGKSTKWQLME